MAKTTTEPRRNLFVRMDDELYAKLQAAADTERRSLSSYVRNVLAAHLETKGGKR